MKFSVSTILSACALSLSIQQTHAAQIGVLAFESDSPGGDTTTYGVRVVCDNDADFSKVDADATCDLSVQNPGGCTVNACGGSYTGTWSATNTRGCGDAISISAGNVNGAAYPGFKGCKRYAECGSGWGSSENGFLCLIGATG